jgi:3-hydroxyisobutyrate dehydrogenase-like beta-hydroxyacid dehydrogenase
MNQLPTIGFIGLGSLGAPIITNILQKGYTVRVYNRTASKVTDWITSLPADLASKVHRTNSPRDTVPSPSGIVVSIVSNDSALNSITAGEDGILAGIGSDGIHLCLSTVSPTITKELTELHSARGASYVACPVFGRPPVAVARKLIAVPAGAPTAVDRIIPILECTTQKIVRAGDCPENSSILKLCGNFMILATVQVHYFFSCARKLKGNLSTVGLLTFQP